MSAVWPRGRPSPSIGAEAMPSGSVPSSARANAAEAISSPRRPAKGERPRWTASAHEDATDEPGEAGGDRRVEDDWAAPRRRASRRPAAALARSAASRADRPGVAGPSASARGRSRGRSAWNRRPARSPGGRRRRRWPRYEPPSARRGGEGRAHLLVHVHGRSRRRPRAGRPREPSVRSPSRSRPSPPWASQPPAGRRSRPASAAASSPAGSGAAANSSGSDTRAAATASAGDRRDALVGEVGSVGEAHLAADPAANPQAPLPRLREALDLAVEDPYLASDRVLRGGLGVVGPGGCGRRRRPARQWLEVHAV